jgi:hypothetical protein
VQISGTSGRKRKVAMQIGREIMPSTMKSLFMSLSALDTLGGVGG